MHEIEAPQMTGLETHEITAPELRLPKRFHNESCKFVLSWKIPADVASLIMKFGFPMFGSGQLTPLRGRSNKSPDQVRGITGPLSFWPPAYQTRPGGRSPDCRDRPLDRSPGPKSPDPRLRLPVPVPTATPTVLHSHPRPTIPHSNAPAV